MRGQVNLDVIFSAVIFLAIFSIFLQNFFSQSTVPEEPKILRISARNLGIFLLSNQYDGNPYLSFGGFGEKGRVNTTKLRVFFGMNPYHLWYILGAKYGFRIKKEPKDVIYSTKVDRNSLLVKIFNQNCNYYVILLVNTSLATYPLINQGKSPVVVAFTSLPKGIHHLYIAIDCKFSYGYADAGVIEIA